MKGYACCDIKYTDTLRLIVESMLTAKALKINKAAFTNVLAVLLIFLCRYNFQFAFLPFTMLQLVQYLGIIYIMSLILMHMFSFPKWLNIFFLYVFALGTFGILSALRDISGTLPLIRSILNVPFFAGITLLIINLLYKNQRLEIGRLLDAWIYASIIQLIITILFFLNNEIFNFVYSFIKLESSIDDRIDLLSLRMIGLGNQFFGAGFNYSIDIFVMTLIPYVSGSKIYKNKLLYWTVVVSIIVVGILSARTFFVGLACALLFLCIQNRHKVITFAGKSIKAILIIVLSCLIFYNVFKSYLGDMENTLNWAFEIFINLFSGEGLSSDSTDVMYSMYRFPENTSTWLFGDGRFYTADGHYYMRTDIGFIRLIFFWGLPCTILYYLYQLYFAKIIYRKSKEVCLKPFLLCFTLFVYLCNMKGYISGDYFLLILLVFTIKEYKAQRSKPLNRQIRMIT